MNHDELRAKLAAALKELEANHLMGWSYVEHEFTYAEKEWTYKT